jgi:hypothetical protein
VVGSVAELRAAAAGGGSEAAAAAAAGDLHRATVDGIALPRELFKFKFSNSKFQNFKFKSEE